MLKVLGWVLAAVGALLVAIAGLYWKRLLSRLDPHLDRHIDAVLSRLRTRSWVGRSHAPPAPPPEGKMEATFSIPSILPGGREPVFMHYPVTWQWSSDRVSDIETGCPKCGRILSKRADTEITLLRRYTLVGCAECGFRASVGFELEQFDNMLKQEIYRVHRGGRAL